MSRGVYSYVNKQAKSAAQHSDRLIMKFGIIQLSVPHHPAMLIRAEPVEL
jgi:hypothetical protein